MSKKIYFVVLLFVIGITTMLKAQEVPTRAQIADKYKWNLSDLYANNSAFEKDFKDVENLAKLFTKNKDQLTKTAQNLLMGIEEYNEIWKRFSRLYMYVSLLLDMDVSNGQNQILVDRVKKLLSDISAITSFYSPELLSVDYSVIENFIKEENKLKDYTYYLEQAFRMKAHTLSSESEAVLAKLGTVISIPNKVYGVLNDSELPLGKVKDSKGTDIQLSHGRYRSALYSTDRTYRENVYKGIYEGYEKVINTYAALFNGRVATRIALSEIRNFKSPLEAALYENNIPIEVFNNLIKTVQDNVSTLHRWAKIKRKALKLDKIHPYDTYVTLFPVVPKKYTYEEGMDIVKEALKPLGKEYIAALEKAFNNRWIDVYETKSKRSGAYSNGCGCGVHPWVLLNWGGTLDDVFVLAHEMGHNMHSYFTEKKQPYHYSDYSIFVAEVASTTNEALLLDYLIKQANTTEEKCALYETFLTNAQATFFRQARFAEFEQMIHSKAQNGEYLSAEELTKLFAERYQYYWGDAMETDKEEGLSWARIHHITKYNFYVYQYSTGFAAAQALSEQIVNEGQPAIDRYLGFLSSGSSDTPINLLKKAGVDMSSPEPINKTIKKMNRYLDELEKLIK